MSNPRASSNQETPSEESPTPAISLPTGGGTMFRIGEKYSPETYTGTGNFTVPIALSPGRNGFQPQLKLVYNTGSSNNLFGFGWSLLLSPITRQTNDILTQHWNNEKICTEVIGRW